MRSASEENRRYFRQAYETGRHGWEAREPSPYVAAALALAARQTGGRRLLDLGCGEGRHSLLAARMGFAPTGVDFEPLAIRRARAAAGEAGLAARIHWLVADVLALPFLSAAFDLVLDYGCLHHQRKSDWARYMRGLRWVLKPGGLFVLSAFSTAFRAYGPQERSWHLAHGAYRRFFTARDLHGLLGREFEFLSLDEEREGTRGFWHALLRKR
jgi:SAM-dependent methyltransferase